MGANAFLYGEKRDRLSASRPPCHMEGWVGFRPLSEQRLQRRRRRTATWLPKASLLSALRPKRKVFRIHNRFSALVPAPEDRIHAVSVDVSAMPAGKVTTKGKRAIKYSCNCLKIVYSCHLSLFFTCSCALNVRHVDLERKKSSKQQHSPLAASWPSLDGHGRLPQITQKLSHRADSTRVTSKTRLLSASDPVKPQKVLK